MRGAAALALATGLALSAWAADAVVPWDDAEQHVGEEVTVEGRVMGIHCSPLSCLLAFDPTFNRFTALIQAEHFDRFPPAELDDRYSGQRVRVHGTIVTRDRKPEISLSDPGNLKLVETKDDRQAKAAKQADAQDQILARLDALLARVEALTERMAATQERMETALAMLAESTQALVAASTPPPPPPVNTEQPQPRQSWEAMRTVKRGMSAGEVRRLMGEPAIIEPSGNGWTLWNYGYGRSISFDNRGRAQSLTGFPGS